jgi:hypothetical protein
MDEARRVDADFAEEVLRDLYRYGGKRRWLAWLLWGTLGWFGAHRFYLDRPATALLMAFTLGGGLVWWLVDAFLLHSMVRAYDAEQALRRRTGQPPIALRFMPPLQRDVLSKPPEWTARWRQAGPTRRRARLVGDALVLVLLGVALGRVAVAADVWESIAAVLVLVVLVTAGGAAGRVAHVPVLRGLLRWSHRLRLFYYYNRPGSPLALLLRPITATVTAPFSRRDRAEVRLYLQLGAVVTVAFLILDFGEEVLGPIITQRRLPALTDVLALWLTEAVVTFVVIYAFATPIGAIITRNLLTMRTHTVPRMLSAVVVAALLLGLAYA